MTQRGNFRREVFFDDEDRLTYMALLGAAATKARLRVLGHCLMSNHLHLIVVPERAESMSAAFRVAHGNYLRWLNIRLRRCGHVWQSRSFSCVLDHARGSASWQS